MKLTILKQTFLLLTIVTTGIHCGKDFLNNPTKNILLRQEYVKDLPSCQAFLNGIYLQFYSSFSHYKTAYPEVIADNLKPETGFGALMSIYSWDQQALEENGAIPILGLASVNMNAIYQSDYLLIRSCNLLINAVGKFRDENPSRVDDMQGQALLIRSMAYFQLVNTFSQAYNFTPGGSHPGVAILTSDDWTIAINGRASVAEVYEEMIKDLQGAITLLPATTESLLLPSKLTAQALLARIYLFKGDFMNAKNTAAAVIIQKPLLTVKNGYPNNIFKSLSPQQTETIFQMLPRKLLSNDNGTLQSGYYLGEYLRDTKKYFTATSDLTDLLTARKNDVRTQWITKTNNSNDVTKFPTGIFAPSGSESTQYYQSIIRSSELYLTAAESFAQLSMEDSARHYLYLIRKRADSTITFPAAVGPQLLDSIKIERRKELAFEGLRLYDLQRWKQGIERSDPLSPNVKSLPYPSEKSIAPIPKMDTKFHGVTQNPGYK